MRRSALPLALGAAMLAAQPAVAQVGSAEPSAREVASVFKDVCLDKTTEGFANFESDLAAWGYTPDGAGYYLNGVHTTTFQLWRGEGAVFCTLFYNKTAPDVVRWTAEVMSAALDRTPGAILNDYDAEAMEYERNIGLLDPIWVEHKPMDSRGDQYAFRLYVVLPE